MREERRNINRSFLYSLIILVVFGLFVLLSASEPLGYQKFGDVFYFFRHQIIHGLIPGIILFSIFAYLDYRRLVKLAPWAMILSIILLLMVFRQHRKHATECKSSFMACILLMQIIRLK